MAADVGPGIPAPPLDCHMTWASHLTHWFSLSLLTCKRGMLTAAKSQGCYGKGPGMYLTWSQPSADSTQMWGVNVNVKDWCEEVKGPDPTEDPSLKSC